MEALGEIERLLASEDRDEVRRGLDMAKELIKRVGSVEARPLFGLLTALFYIDPYDRPDLKPCLDEAIDLMIGFGDWVIPRLIHQLDDSDLKAQIVVANALGRLGADAIDPLLDAYRDCERPERRPFILYALGHVRSPKVVKALDAVIEAAVSADPNLRDTALRTIGRMFESIEPGAVEPDRLQRVVGILRGNLADPNPGIRAKAVRSLGKLARYGHLDPEQEEWLCATLKRILGTDDAYDWDRAYIVRKEAKEALAFCPAAKT